MMADVASAMKHLVELGYVHRDLAARNIQINAQLRCKLADMSMARKIADTQFPHQVRYYYHLFFCFDVVTNLNIHILPHFTDWPMSIQVVRTRGNQSAPLLGGL